jgi:hypothetical protein
MRYSQMFVQDVLALLARHYANDNSESKCNQQKVGNDENFVFVHQPMHEPHKCRDGVEQPREKRDAAGIMLDPDYSDLIRGEEEAQNTRDVREGINAEARPLGLASVEGSSLRRSE